MRRVRSFRRPSLATISALAALIVALTTPAWGANVTQLITGSQIAANAVTSAKVKDHSLLRVDVKAAQASRGRTGSAGPRGPAGATGFPGARGTPGQPGTPGTSGTAGPVLVAGAWTTAPPNPVLYTDTTMVDLATGQSTTGQITLPTAGELNATGEATLDNATSAAAYGRCKLDVSDGTGPDNGLELMGPLAFTNLLPSNTAAATISVNGAIALPAGTYNVALECSSFTNQLDGYSAGLTVWATANS